MQGAQFAQDAADSGGLVFGSGRDNVNSWAPEFQALAYASYEALLPPRRQGSRKLLSLNSLRLSPFNPKTDDVRDPDCPAATSCLVVGSEVIGERAANGWSKAPERLALVARIGAISAPLSSPKKTRPADVARVPTRFAGSNCGVPRELPRYG